MKRREDAPDLGPDVVAPKLGMCTEMNGAPAASKSWDVDSADTFDTANTATTVAASTVSLRIGPSYASDVSSGANSFAW